MIFNNTAATGIVKEVDMTHLVGHLTSILEGEDEPGTDPEYSDITDFNAPQDRETKYYLWRVAELKQESNPYVEWGWNNYSNGMIYRG
jgi:hypothetical protein